MKPSLQNSLVELFRSVSKAEKFRNRNLQVQADKILSLLSEIRSIEQEKRNACRRMQPKLSLIRGLN